jgi:hypothetical protein
MEPCYCGALDCNRCYGPGAKERFLDSEKLGRAYEFLDEAIREVESITDVKRRYDSYTVLNNELSKKQNEVERLL